MTVLMREMISFLKDRVKNLQAIYLFGSMADGTAHSGSDLDVALLTETSLKPVERWSIQEDLAGRLHRDVDLVDLRCASTVMQMQVVSHGLVIYDADSTTRQAFEVFVYSSYARFNEERKEILKVIREEGRVYA